MKQRILCLLLALCLFLTPALGAEAPNVGAEAPVLDAEAPSAGTEAPVAASPLQSGFSTLPKLTQAQITQLLKDNPLGFAGDAFTAAPSPAAPYKAGTVSDAALHTALNRLNLLRRLAGLNSVELDQELTSRCQYGAVLLAAGGTLSHHPGKPQDMDESFYQKGLNATSSSNIYMGTNATLPQAVDAFMGDSDQGNLPTVGHRRWMLNPTMGKTGFGFSSGAKNSVVSAYNFATLWAFDRSATPDSYDFIGWPASGAFPATLFQTNHAWSVTLNPEKYAVPDKKDLTVTLTRAADGASWSLSGAENYAAADTGAFLGVDRANYGVANCIIFRPPLDASSYDGTYTVTVDGVKTTAGDQVDFTYQVDFFTPGAASPVQQPAETPSATRFSDVPANAWYAADVTYAADKGLFNGVGNDRFDPDGSMTRVMLMTVLARLDGADTTPQGKESWFIKGHRWAVTNRISDGLNPHQALTLEELSTMLYNYAKLRYGATAAHNFHLAGMPDGDSVSSWAAEGTNWMVDQGLLQGDQNQLLNPRRTATRAQVAALLHRFLTTQAPS